MKTIDIPSVNTETKVRVEELTALHLGLARAFGEVGVGGKQLEDVFELAVTARCLGCGIEITGTELGRIAVMGDGVVNPEPKLERLRLGYCARNGCTTKFYSIHCESLPGLDTQKVLARAVELRHQPAPEPEPEPTTPVPPKPWFRNPKWVLVVLLLLGASYYSFRYAADRGFVPGVPKKPIYQIDPSKAQEAL